ncbi:MAG: S49 family peptidase [Gammaproteobacteria bacterium]
MTDINANSANQEQSNKPSPWQQNTLENILLETLREQKRKRRWNILFKAIFLGIFIYFIVAVNTERVSATATRTKPHTALIDIRGEIGASTDASADNIATALNEAFKDANTKGIILRINSPGGTPVQASYVFNEIWRLRQLHPKIKIYAVCSDICTSAAYYIASATNDIYANPSSLIGSIGVMLDGFGFNDTMQKLGVQRRLIISGAEKGFLDPFSPLNPNDQTYAQNMLNIVHQQFIDAVKLGRGNRLKADPNLFSGLPWTGVQALQLGLIDNYGSAGYVARNVIKNSNIVDYTQRPGFFYQLSNRIGSSFYHQFAADLGLKGISLK